MLAGGKQFTLPGAPVAALVVPLGQLLGLQPPCPPRQPSVTIRCRTSRRALISIRMAMMLPTRPPAVLRLQFGRFDDDGRTLSYSGGHRSAAGSGRATVPLAAASGGGEGPAGGEEEWMKLAKASVVEDKLLAVTTPSAKACGTCSPWPSLPPPHSHLSCSPFPRPQVPISDVLCPLPPCRRLSARALMPPARACSCWRCSTSSRPAGTASSSSASHA